MGFVPDEEAFNGLQRWRLRSRVPPRFVMDGRLSTSGRYQFVQSDSRSVTLISKRQHIGNELLHLSPFEGEFHFLGIVVRVAQPRG